MFAGCEDIGMKKRKIYREGVKAFVPLTMGKKAVIDICDVHLVDGYNWTCAKRGGGLFYAYRQECIGGGKMKSILMHRVILSASDNDVVDHVDRDGLNNTKENLRICTHAENMRNRKMPSHNTSGFKGVKKTKSGRWSASIGFNGRNHHLGTFDSPEDAIIAYSEASRKMHVDFGRTV